MALNVTLLGLIQERLCHLYGARTAGNPCTLAKFNTAGSLSKHLYPDIPTLVDELFEISYFIAGQDLERL